MEPLTQAVAAITFSRLSLAPMSRRDILLFIVAFLVPDVDRLSSLFGAGAFLRFHRTLLHSLPDAFLLALILAAAAVLLPSKKKSTPRLTFARAFLISCLGLAGHIVLDLCDPVGAQLFWPIRAKWYAWDLAAMLDPWILLALICFLGLGWVLKIAGEEISSESESATLSNIWPRRWAAIAVLALVAYFTARGALHHRALQLLAAPTYSDQIPVAMAAFPSAVSPFDWRGVVSTRDFINELDVPLRPSGAFDPSTAIAHPKPEPSPALDRALQAPPAKEFLRYAKFSLANVEPAEINEEGSSEAASAPNSAAERSGDKNTVIQLRDLRFPQSLRSPNNLILIVELDAQQNILRAEVEFAHHRH
jgi:membrane-bound metal-dependent hydrolase YbcI (DUF457 family)